MKTSKIAKSKLLSPRLIYTAMTILQEMGGELSAREVIEEVESRVQLDDWAKHRHERTGQIRWKTILSFMTLYSTKVGYLIKKRRMWYLTAEGEVALKLGESSFDLAVENGYRDWKL